MSACACYRVKWCNWTRSLCTQTFVLYAWILYLNRKQDQDLDSMYSAILLEGVSLTTNISFFVFLLFTQLNIKLKYCCYITILVLHSLKRTKLHHFDFAWLHIPVHIISFLGLPRCHYLLFPCSFQWWTYFLV